MIRSNWNIQIENQIYREANISNIILGGIHLEVEQTGVESNNYLKKKNIKLIFESRLEAPSIQFSHWSGSHYSDWPVIWFNERAVPGEI